MSFTILWNRRVFHELQRNEARSSTSKGRYLLVYERMSNLGGTCEMGKKISQKLKISGYEVREVDWIEFTSLSSVERKILLEFTPIIVNSKAALVYFSRIERLTQFFVLTWNRSDFYFKLASYLGDMNKGMILCEPVLSSENDLILEFPQFVIQICVTNCTHALEIKNGQKPRIVFIGRLNFQKGIDTFIKLARRNQDLEFMIIGSGPLEKYVKQRVTSIPNLLYLSKKTNPVCSLRRPDIVVIPSRYFEGLNLVLLETLHHKMRVISSGVGLMGHVRSNSHYHPDSALSSIDTFLWLDTKIKELTF